MNLRARLRTIDFQTVDRNNILATTNLGVTRKLTPEGFLLCQGVAIGRTGEQIYTEQDLPKLKGDAGGYIRVTRPIEVVFDPDSMASFEGKAITLNHPAEFVTPETWKHVAIGTIHNVRRGVGTQDDALVADLLVTDASAIVYANKELPEISLGYDAEYAQDEPGKAVQRKIVGNHAAFVKKGRAGVRFKVKDEDTVVDKLKALWAAVVVAISTKDTAAIDTAVSDLSKELTGQPVKTTDAEVVALSNKVDALTATVAQLVTQIATITTKDVAPQKPLYASDKLGDIQARVEVLSPGLKIPTGDAATVDAIENAMQTALTAAETKFPTEVKAVLMGKTVNILTGDSLLGTTIAISELAKARNEASQTASAGGRMPTKDYGVPTAAELNATYEKFWSGRAA